MLTHMGFLKLVVTTTFIKTVSVGAASGNAQDSEDAHTRACFEPTSFRKALAHFAKVVCLADSALDTLPAGEPDRTVLLHKVNALYELGRLAFLLGEEDRGVEFLEQHLDLMISLGRGACELCHQTRLEERKTRVSCLRVGDVEWLANVISNTRSCESASKPQS